MYSVTKEFSFDAAHRLVQGYQGKCANIHGHTWKVRFTSQSTKLNTVGFVRDFGDFKPLKEFIDQRLDHAVIVSQEDAVLIQFLQENDQKHFISSSNPTSELLAELLFHVAHNLGMSVNAVEVDETCTCRARYEL